MRTVIDAVGPFTLRLERERFGMLVRSIISQQISTSAARSIRTRLQELAGTDGLIPANLARFKVDQLRSVGLSPQKASYVVDLACKVNDGIMAGKGRQTLRKPATKFAHLRKKMEKNQIASKISKKKK
jgi:DNA-3-methyladenine glycosylase II